MGKLILRRRKKRAAALHGPSSGGTLEPSWKRTRDGNPGRQRSLPPRATRSTRTGAPPWPRTFRTAARDSSTWLSGGTSYVCVYPFRERSDLRESFVDPPKVIFHLGAEFHHFSLGVLKVLFQQFVYRMF